MDTATEVTVDPAGTDRPNEAPVQVPTAPLVMLTQEAYVEVVEPSALDRDAQLTPADVVPDDPPVPTYAAPVVATRELSRSRSLPRPAPPRRTRGYSRTRTRRK